MRQRLVDAAPCHHVATEKNLHERGSSAKPIEPDPDMVTCSSLLGWPKGVERSGAGSDHILDLARRQARSKQGENGAGGGFRIDARIVIHRLVNARAQRAETLRGSMFAGAPSLIIEAAQQRGQLRAEIHDLVARQRVAQSVQRADQGGVRLSAIAPTQPLRQIVDPGVCFSNGAAEFAYLSQLASPRLEVFMSTKNSSLSLGFPIIASPIPSTNTSRMERRRISSQRSRMSKLPRSHSLWIVRCVS